MPVRSPGDKQLAQASPLAPTNSSAAYAQAPSPWLLGRGRGETRPRVVRGNVSLAAALDAPPVRLSDGSDNCSIPSESPTRQRAWFVYTVVDDPQVAVEVARKGARRTYPGEVSAFMLSNGFFAIGQERRLARGVERMAERSGMDEYVIISGCEIVEFLFWSGSKWRLDGETARGLFQALPSLLQAAEPAPNVATNHQALEEHLCRQYNQC